MKRLKQRWLIAATLLVLGLAVTTATSALQSSAETRQGSGPPDSGVTATYAIGEVGEVDASGGHLTVATSSGEVTVRFDDKTQFLRLAPGETTLEKAAPITLADVGAGDRVLARGKVSEDRKSVAARQLIVMTRADIARKQEREREEWRRRSVAGTVTAIDPARREITLQVRAREGSRPVVVAAPDSVAFRRYAPDSVRFADALPSAFEDLKAGNLLRALGERSPDGSRLQAEQVVFGSFVMVGGPVVSVDSAAGGITMDDIPTGKRLTVVISPYSALRRIPPQIAALLALRGQANGRPPSGPGAGPPPGGPGSPGGRFGQERPGGPGALPAGRQAEGGSARRGPPAGGGDLQEMLERLPAIALSDLKPGDWILASSTIGANPLRVTAILLAAGIEPLLALQRVGEIAAPGASLGLPGGALDFEIGLPE